MVTKKRKGPSFYSLIIIARVLTLQLTQCSNGFHPEDPWQSIKQDTHDYDFGLYKTTVWAYITKASLRQTEKIKKDLCNIFGKHGLKITIKANTKTKRKLPRCVPESV